VHLQTRTGIGGVHALQPAQRGRVIFAALVMMIDDDFIKALVQAAKWGGEGGGAGGSSLKNLHAMVVCVSHDDAPVAVDGDAAMRAAELSFA
jgi:hypothetical protein